MAKKLYGKKVVTGIYPCRFPDIHTKKDGKFQIEIVVPKDEAVALNDELYGGDEKLINHNKASAKAKKPRNLWSPLYLYDEEAGEPMYEDDGETRLESDTHVVFRFKSQFAPQIQFKKGLDKTAKVGYNSQVQISGALFGSETVDDKGKPIDYCLLSLQGVRVHVLEVSEKHEAFEDDDEFEDAEGEYEDAQSESSESTGTADNY